MRKFRKPRNSAPDSDNSQPDVERQDASAAAADRRTAGAWTYVFWTIVSLLALALVVGYDRRNAAEGKFHLNEGRSLAQNGRFDDAAAEFRLALRNQRLSNNLRAEAAVLLAELEHKERGNTSAAIELLQDARRLSFRASDRLDVPGRIRALQESPARPATATIGALSVAPPPEETSGPVLATLPSGRTIHIGALEQRLRRAGLLHSPQFRQAPDRLEQELAALIEEEQAFERALAEGVASQPEFQRELWHLARGMLAAQRRQLRRLAPGDEAVEERARAIYQARISQYQRPATVSVAAIVAATSETAALARQALIDGAAFADVATSYSIDSASARRGGLLEDIREGQDEVPPFGAQPGLYEKLRNLPIGAITLPAPIGGKWAIFQARRHQPGINIAYDEVRDRLLAEALRQSASSTAPPRLDELEAATDVRLLGNFYDFVDGVTTGPVQLTLEPKAVR